jgi:hypothetical protein
MIRSSHFHRARPLYWPLCKLAKGWLFREVMTGPFTVLFGDLNIVNIDNSHQKLAKKQLLFFGAKRRSCVSGQNRMGLSTANLFVQLHLKRFINCVCQGDKLRFSVLPCSFRFLEMRYIRCVENNRTIHFITTQSHGLLHTTCRPDSRLFS